MVGKNVESVRTVVTKLDVIDDVSHQLPTRACDYYFSWNWLGGEFPTNMWLYYVGQKFAPNFLAPFANVA